MKEIILTTGEQVLVDDEDYPLLSRFKWRRGAEFIGWPTSQIYKGRGVTVPVLMYQIVLGGVGKAIPIDGNKFNLQKDNLRTTTKSEKTALMTKRKTQNRKKCTSKYKGVTWHKVAKKWCAQIAEGGVHYYLGLFESEEKAAQAYNKKAKELYKDFVLLNGDGEKRVNG